MTVAADPALGFWLRHVAAAGGLWEPEGPAAYVVLPPPLRDAYRLPEELRVTADPDVAREDGAALLAAGHPVLAEAADRVLKSGDAGHLVLTRPASVPPGREVLLTELRDAFPVGHGRIDLAGEPEAVLHPVARVGALITYELSAEDRFQEQAERWVDLPAWRELPAALAAHLVRAETSEQGVARPAEGLLPAIREAHRLIDAGATARREALGAEVIGACQAESGRAAAYYADAISGIERRLATAPADRLSVLEQRLRSTREEKARRLAEIAEKYEARHTIRPYRLHVIHVPGLRVSVDVRRGDRRYPMIFDWLMPAGAYAPVRCPSCGGEAPLVAGKLKLGCETCLPPVPAAAAVPVPAASPAVPGPEARPSAASRPVPGAAQRESGAAQRESGAAQQESGAAQQESGPRRPAAGSVPAPPRAKQQPAMPPKVRKERQKATGTVAERMWRAVAAGDIRAAGKVLLPGSPAAALVRALGPAGLTRVIGMPPGEGPEKFVAETDGDTVAGRLLGHGGAECSYYIYCRDGQAAEVLPFPLHADESFWPFYWWGRRPGDRWATGKIVAAPQLDPVEGPLVSVGSSWNGLPVAARSLAAWERISGGHEPLLSAHAPRTLAAAVQRLVAYRAGSRAAFAEAAGAYRVPEEEVRRADRAVRRLLALGPARPW